MKKSLNIWLEKFGDAWCNKDIDLIMSLFDKENITYFESVFNPPVISWREVKKLWEVVPINQKDITFNYEIISHSENQGIVNWKVSRLFIPTNENQEINGIFQIRLNKNNQCIFFKQWRMTKIV